MNEPLQLKRTKPGADGPDDKPQAREAGAAPTVSNQAALAEQRSALRVAPADDPLEREADAVAERALAGATVAEISAAPPGVQRVCAQGAVDVAHVQRKSRNDAPAPATRVSLPRGGGEPLPPSLTNYFGSRLGADLAPVRVHTGHEASTAAKQLNARAYTHGTDIVFGDGEYLPGTAAGQRLIAHELTHVVQQAGQRGVITRQVDAGVPDITTLTPASDTIVVQRQDDESADSERASGGPAPELSGLPMLTDDEERRLQTAIGSTYVYELIHQRHAMERRFNHEESRGMGIIRHIPENVERKQRLEQEIRRELDRLHVADERALLYLVEVGLPNMVLARAKQVAHAMLERNKELATAEMSRYAGQVCTPDTAGLLAADQELGDRFRALQSTQLDLSQAARYTSNVTAGAPENTPEAYGIPPQEASVMVIISNISEYRQRFEIQKREFDETKRNLGASFPVLLAKGYEPGSFSRAPPEDLATLTAQPLQEIIDNINEVQEAVRNDEMKVWNMRNVIEMTIAEMGIASDPVLLNAVQARVKQVVEDEAFEAKFKVATMLLTTIFAGLVGGPLAAAVVSGFWGGYSLAEDISTYRMESAAENVAMDPELRDISINEPELLWIVLDVIGLGLDAGAIVGALRPFARAALRTGRIAEFAEAAGRIAPRAAGRLIQSLRSRLGRQALEEVATGAGRQAMGAGKTLDEYVDAMRAERHEAGSIGRSWDHQNQPRGLPESKWRPGDPIDMPNSAGTYPAYDVVRKRYWRNRAHIELDARQRGLTTHSPGATTDPLAGLSEDELRSMAESGRAPSYAYPNRPGQTWELEHVGVPQRVGGWLSDLGFSQGESRRLIQASSPGSLLEATPVEHAFFDYEAWRFGRLRADVAGARWATSTATDVRIARPLYYMSDDTIREIVQRAAAGGMDFNRSAATRQLRDAIRAEVSQRALGITVP